MSATGGKSHSIASQEQELKTGRLSRSLYPGVPCGTRESVNIGGIMLNSRFFHSFLTPGFSEGT